jgi:hypothetical protein
MANIKIYRNMLDLQIVRFIIYWWCCWILVKHVAAFVELVELISGGYGGYKVVLSVKGLERYVPRKCNANAYANYKSLINDI